MAKEFYGRELSACETLIMKIVWDYDGDIPLKDLMASLKEEYHKDYARTTVATFLTRLHNKGFIETYRKGRASFTHPLKDQDKYKEKLLKEDLQFWFGGNMEALLAALCKAENISEEDTKKLCEMTAAVTAK